MARVGPKVLGHYKTLRGLIDLVRVLHKEGRRGYQARFFSVGIGIDIQLSMAIITN